ncbi:MAG: hypothetical protein Q4B55_07845, partial [Lachnospiraceae bacterium]|nr:hypothetical protein [Lachnospiraceae bacterium]
MSLQIVVGAASSGKSNRLITDLTERSLRLPEEKFFIIVPEQATLNMQLNVVKHLQMQGAKGTPVRKTAATMNIDVVSFDRLAHVVFADLGIDAA